ncbi:MAG: Asp-tRNA(Asn)/Glu-tRNA(Gln) amidotransferase subunit GatC [Gammaproteobacteria bacterium]
MSLDKSEIEKIAWLARLDIEQQDIDNFSQELTGILDLVEQMNNVNTDHISPLAHPLDIAARLREDKVTETNQRENFQEHAPATEDGYYLVPRVIE